jgi:hypothetical protein
VLRQHAGHWEPAQAPLLSLLCLVYLCHVTFSGLRNEKISVKDLKDAHFFQGPHALDIAGVMTRFGRDPEGFRIAAARLGGTPIDGGDAAVELWPFPKIPLYLILWAADAEFDASLSVLFDRSIERHLAADGIWGLVNLVCGCLLEQPLFKQTRSA